MSDEMFLVGYKHGFDSRYHSKYIMTTVSEYFFYLCDYLGRLNGFINSKQKLPIHKISKIQGEIRKVEREIAKIKGRKSI